MRLNMLEEIQTGQMCIRVDIKDPNAGCSGGQEERKYSIVHCNAPYNSNSNLLERKSFEYLNLLEPLEPKWQQVQTNIFQAIMFIL